MQAFQKIVLLSAIVILIITLIFIGLALRKSKKGQTWPPMIPECPDYWTLESVDGKPICYSNNMNLGNCKTESTKDFNTSTFTGAQGACAKYTWATRCGISWDGITYGVKNPCFQS